MLVENRKYHFIGELTLNRSRILDEQCLPKDDKVNWLFLNLEEHQFSFIYKFEKPLEARYEKPFKIKLAFPMIETIRDVIELNCFYEVLRGEELIGRVVLIESLGW